ncbi:MAG: SUMF1/EgtB/PvdO family nonheme iron enzyme, partial [Lentisphaeria bacterium]|nr:SUMF1/EgtB/PvdO family nonheme iron enzyme [Lentisphaeria bacterium]
KIEEKDYYIGKYEVTQAQWQAVMGNNPSYFKGADRPVENVNWYDAMRFCNKLNYLGLAPRGYEFTLPTEAQWEYAARGGNESKGYKYSGSNDVDEVAWYEKNSGGQTHPVGEKKPNELGLYDMSGNVCEWCLDADGPYRILRGGSLCYDAYSCRVACRSDRPDGRSYSYGSSSGFRLALVPVQ